MTSSNYLNITILRETKRELLIRKLYYSMSKGKSITWDEFLLAVTKTKVKS